MPKINNKILINNSEIYDDYFKERGVKSIEHNSFGNLNLDFNQEFYSYNIHVWRKGDTMIRLANKYYNDYSLWYLIGFFNKKPIDSLYNLGETVKIPTNIEDVIFLINQG